MAREREEQLDPRSGGWIRARRSSRSEQRARSFEERLDVRAGEQAVVSDLDVALGQHVLDEASEELDRRDRDRLAVLGAEGDVVVADVNDPAVRDPDSMRVATEVAEDVLGPGEGLFGIDDPTVLRDGGAEALEARGIGERVESREAATIVFASQRLEELAAEDRTENAHRQEVGGS